MPLPLLEAGLVVNYAYLWARQKKMGHEEGLKNRPCAIVAAVAGEGDLKTVYVMPITHTPPLDSSVAIELALDTKKRLGLDAKPSWIMCDEVNKFRWPGFDLRPVSRGRHAYGVLPPALFREALTKLKEYNRSHQLKVVSRDAALAAPKRR